MLPDNPIHESPSPGSVVAGDRPVSADDRKRPIGVAILSVLHFVGGLALLAITPGLILKFGELGRAGQAVGISAIAITAGTCFLAVLSIAVGVGLWRGSRWGWWIGGFYYAYGVARNASAILFVLGIVDELGNEGRGAGYYLVKHAARIAVHFLILLYFFKENVRTYFGTSDVPKGRAVGRLVAACAALGAVGAVLSLLTP